MTAVILAGTDAVEFFVVHPCEAFAAFGVLPYPICEGLFNELLLALSNGCFFLIENSNLLAVFVLDIVEDTHIFQIERFLHDLISVDSVRAVGVIRFYIASVVGFALNIPFAGIF